MDLSQLSDQDLDALSRNDMKSVSDHALDVISAQTAPKDTTPAPTMGESAVRGAAQGATLGFGDELAGLHNALTKGTVAESDPNAVGNDMIGHTTMDAAGILQKLYQVATDDKSLAQHLDQAKQDYISGRDAERARNAQAQQANPVTYGATNIAASAVPLIATGATSIPGMAAQGAVQGLGDSDADLTKGEYGQAALDTGVGGVVGGVTGAVAPYVGKALGSGVDTLGSVGKKAVKMAGKFGAGIPEDVTERYIANPGVVKNALPLDQVAEGILGTDENSGAIEQLKQHVSGLDSQAWSTLSTEPTIPKDDILSVGNDFISSIVGGKNGTLNRTGAVGAGATKISAIDSQLEQIQKAYGDNLSEGDLKSIVKDLQDLAYSMDGNPKYTQQAQGIRQLSGIYNDILKQYNPEYAAAMEPVQEATSQLQSMQKAFVNKQDPDSLDKAINAVKSYGRKSDLSSVKQAVDYTDQAVGGDLDQGIQASLDKAQFNKTDTQGSRKTMFGTAVGALGGYLMHGPAGAFEGAAIGSGVGQVADKYAGQAFQKVLDTGIGIEKFASKLGPYTKILTDASKRGPQAVAATHYLLQQRDQKYRERINAINGSDE